MEPRKTDPVAPAESNAARPAPDTPREPAEAPSIRRFVTAERLLHWALALPFTILYATAFLMVALYGEPAPRTLREMSSWVHRAAGIALIVLPPLALVLGRREWRAHLENLREGWTWTRDDIRWLILFPRAAVNPKIRLPEQDKFNAAEKLNFMMVSLTYPLYIVTGVLVWMPRIAFVEYLAHFAMAVLGLPLVLGHIFMATVNPETRVGLSGMITGWVDREWAKHHYRKWYRQHFERSEKSRPREAMVVLLTHPSRVKCAACDGVSQFGSWQDLLERAFRFEPPLCSSCHEPLRVVSAERNPLVAETILRHLENGHADEALADEEFEAA